MSVVAIFSERLDVALELLGPALELAGDAGSVVALVAAEGGDVLFQHGAARVLSLTATGDAASTAATLAGLVPALAPDVMLLGATRDGCEIAARLAQRLGVACASACTALSLDAEGLVVERRALGRFVERQRVLSRPALATLPLRRFEPPPGNPARTGRVEQIPEGQASLVRVVASRQRSHSHVDIEKARVVVSVGRGLRRPEDVAVAADLARALGGEVGASRPLTDYLEWLPADVKVGLSGHTVRPDLYVACGISGQVEHIVGMREARVVVAINVDPAAPIFNEADYWVVGDLYEVVPALTRAVEALAKR